jgi:hypothetical protein
MLKQNKIINSDMIDQFQKQEKLISYISLALIIVYPLLFIWQGLDFTDMGYWLTGYQQFLIAPEGISTGLLNWASYALGWLVATVSSDFGVVTFKIAFVPIVWLILYLVYMLIHDKTPKNWQIIILPILFITQAYVIAKTTGNYINYNNLTALFFILTALTLYRGLTTTSLFLIGLSGFFVGFNLFVRFPNLLGIILILLIVMWGWTNNSKLIDILRQSSSFLLGIAIAVIMVFMLIGLSGHMDYYLDGLANIFIAATDTESHHSSGRLLKLFIRDHLFAFIGGTLALLGSYFIANLLQSTTRIIKIFTILSLSIIIIPIFNYANSWKWFVTGAMYLVLLAGVGYGLKRDKPLMLLCLLAGSVLLLVPLGSGNGMYNALYGSWLALPLMFVLLVRLLDSGFKHFKWKFLSISLTPLPLMAMLIVSVILLFSMGKFFYTQRDHPNRLLMTHNVVGYPSLNGVYTTKARARVVEELLNELNKHVEIGDVLLTYNEIPMLHYLTKTRPWLENPWIMLASPEVIRNKLKQKIIQGEQLPVIVRAIGNTSSPYWPVNSKEFSKNSHENKIRLIFSHFERENSYRVIWSNDFFEILKYGK